MEVPSEKDFSNEKQAFATYLENRPRGDSVEEDDNSRNANAELVEKFEKFLKMEELLKHGLGKRGHHGRHGHHGHGPWRSKHGENKEIEEYLKFCKHGKFGHKHGHHWGKGSGKHYHHGMLGKHAPGFARHGHGKHVRHGKHHGHHGHHHYAHGPWEGKHFWSILAMFNELPETGTEEASQGVNENVRNPLAPPQETTDDAGGKNANCTRCEYKRLNRHGYCGKRRKHSHKTVQPIATSTNAAGTSTQSNAAMNAEAPPNLVSMVENISIDNSPRARAETE